MKTKKWQVVTIVSLVAIVIEVVLFFLLAMPAMKTNKLFKALDAGDASEASDIYDSLSDGAQEKVQEKLDDFGTYQVNQYIDGKLEYDKVKKILDAASGLDKACSKVMAVYNNKADSIELVKLYEAGVQDYMVNEDTWSSGFEDAYDDFGDIYWSMDDESVADDELYNYFDAKYQAYQEGTLDVDAMDAYAYTGEYFFAYGTDAYDLASQVSSDMYYIKMYQEDLEIAQQYYDEEDYFSCIDYCDNELEWSFYEEDDTTGYKEKFQALRDDAYEAGKTYYLTEAENLINSGDVEGGQDILTRMDELYGDDVDTSSVWALTRGAWMIAYVEYMDNWRTNVPADMVSGVKIGNYDDPATLDYSTYEPYELYLYDFDENGTPEMLLRGYDYHYFIYTYDGSKVVFTGAVCLVSIPDTSKLLVEPISCPEGYEGYELLRFENNAWVVEEYYIGNGTDYEVNGQPATAEEAEAVYNKFYDMDTSTTLEYADIDDYEEFIYSYED